MSLLRSPRPWTETPLHDPDRPRRGRPPARNEILRAGRLGGLDPTELAARFGTPIYVYDLEVATRQVEALKAVLPPAFEVAYAVKANPALAVVHHMGSLGLGADVASSGELATTMRAGIPPERIVFTGPGKRDEELRLASRLGLRAVTVESLGELERLERIAADADRVVSILLRASVSAAARLERVRLVGDDGAGKFGMSSADLEIGAQRATQSAHLNLLGMHAFGASNILDADAFADHVAATMTRARQLALAVGAPLRLVDVGGGLGIPYGPDERSLDLHRMGQRLEELAAEWRRDPVLRKTAVLLEPGRFLIGPAGAYLARVVDRKTVDGSHVVVLDGGIHHLLRPALTGQEHRIRALGHATGSGGKVWPVTVAGPLCSGLDVFTQHADMVPPRVGDLVAVLDVGAYGYTESMPLFLSHPIPAEVAINGGEAKLIRPAIDPSTWLDMQLLPAWAPRAWAESAGRASRTSRNEP